MRPLIEVLKHVTEGYKWKLLVEQSIPRKDKPAEKAGGQKSADDSLEPNQKGKKKWNKDFNPCERCLLLAKKKSRAYSHPAKDCKAFTADHYKQALRHARKNNSRDSTDGNYRGNSRSNKYRKGRDGKKYRSKNKSDEASDFLSRKEFNALHKDLKKILNNHNKDDH